MPGIRNLYDTYGPEGYYKAHASDYENPHIDQISALLKRNMDQWRGKTVLDLGAGTGQVSQVLLQNGNQNIFGIDPFLHREYQLKTGKLCLPLDFDGIVKGAELPPFEAVIASFSLHLCSHQALFPLFWRLTENNATVAILTPHKRPDLSPYPQFEEIASDFELTEKGKKVFYRLYRRAI